MNCLEEKQINRETKLKKTICVTFATAFVMLFFCAWTSPLYLYNYGGDNAIFMLIGKGITEGKICYKELFDHKGPIMFFIQALGWKIAGRTGVWIIETIFTIVSVGLIIKICGLMSSKALLPLISTAAVYLYLFGGGDLCENYCMPFIYFCVYLTAKYCFTESTTHPPLYAFIYGICFGIIAFIRVNNAVVICSCILFVAIDLVINKSFKNLLLNLAAGLGGIVVITIPICIYFYRNDALYDMIYATFLHNWLYAQTVAHVSLFSSLKTFVEQIILFAPLIFSVIVWFKNFRKTNEKFSMAMFVTTCMCIVLMIFVNMSGHYFTPTVPVFTLAVAIRYPNFIIEDVRKEGVRNYINNKKMLPLLLVMFVYFLLSSYRAAIPIYKVYLTDIASDRYEEVQKCIQVIPENERDSVIGYEIATTWYLDSEITPCYKYYSMQHWWSTPQNDVNGDFVQYVESEHPLWLITPKNVEDEKLNAIIDNEYKLMTVGVYDYYRYCGEGK